MVLETADNGLKIKEIASAIFNTGIRTADPESYVALCLQLPADDLQVAKASYYLKKINKLYFIGFGKASEEMIRSAVRSSATTSTTGW